VTFDGATIDVSLTEETGKINLNHAGDDILDRLLTSAGVVASEKAALVDAILDWRDGDNTPRPYGAEDSEYAFRGHGARDGLFVTVDELRLVLGMTEAVFQLINGQLTVFGEHSRVSAEAASEEVLLTLAGGDESRVEAYLRDREHADGGGAAPFDRADAALAQRVRGDVFTVISSARSGTVEARVEATLRMPRRGSNTVVALAWD
jgi:general secretion pathway protein K